MLSSSDTQSISQGVQGIKDTVVGIFENNVMIALAEFIPGFGPAFGVYSSYDTGLALAALAQSNPSTGVSGLELFFVLLLTPILLDRVYLLLASGRGEHFTDNLVQEPGVSQGRVEVVTRFNSLRRRDALCFSRTRSGPDQLSKVT